MADLLLLLLLFTAITNVFSLVHPNGCSHPSTTPTCNAQLYIDSSSAGLPSSPSDIAALYSTDASLVRNITRPTGRTDMLVGVPCSCLAAGSTSYHFHETKYKVRKGDTLQKVAGTIFSSLPWNMSQKQLVAGDVINVLLPCGCGGGGGGIVSYALEPGDTLFSVAQLLDSDVVDIDRMNGKLTERPEFLNSGWVLFVPQGVVPASPEPPPPLQQAKKGKLGMALGISMCIVLLLVGGVLLFYRWRNQSLQAIIEDSKMAAKNILLPPSIAALESQYLHKMKVEDYPTFEKDRPVTFSLQDVETATAKFDETRKIGEGGYGCVYHGILEKQEVAIKKMRSSKSKEFFAELKVLCKVHHKNVNGSLSEHLHNPLLRGHQPLSWNARAQIALDAARGIEYIHDHTKDRYVHRDIKTTNILLDKGLRAKVADFGLVKLVERSNDEDFLATRLVGTPGYLPPEAIRELQMTSKTDVFAFGVVLAELITGHCALLRDNSGSEPNRLISVISIMNRVFKQQDTETALEDIIDKHLKNSCPLREVHNLAKISVWCLNEDPVNRPEMREITVRLNQILMSSREWEASLGGNSQVFSGTLNGR